MFKDGTYRVYSVRQTNGDPAERFLARFLINNNKFNILEDYENLLSGNSPEGDLDPSHDKLIWNLLHSGYYKVIHEDEGNQGAYEPLIQEMDIGGDKQPDATYLIIDNFNEYEEPKQLEMFGETAFLDGERISDEELKQIVESANTGHIRMLPE